MNKLQGFEALKQSGLPAVPWKKYEADTHLDPQILWTIRSAVVKGDDLNLPRKVGVTAQEAQEFATGLLENMSQDDLVIYYPYFIADKSGVMEVSDRRVVIEAVAADLWNLVTHNKKEVTIIFEDQDLRFVGNDTFLNQEELLELVDRCNQVKRLFAPEIASGKSMFLEWSYAYQSNIQKERTGERSLIFYEIRTVDFNI